MRYFKFAVLGIMALGISAHAAIRDMEAGISALGSDLTNNGAYLPGAGFNGFTTMERPMGAAVGGLGVRADYNRLQVRDTRAGKDLNEGGVDLTGLVGPNTLHFQPLVGGHVGYARFEENNLLDLGVDGLATYKITDKFGVHALVTPTWLMDRHGNSDYLTKIGLGVLWTTPSV